MKIIVVGCGKLGSSLANYLDKKGNEVTVISSDETKFKKLSPDFKGKIIAGLEIDKETLVSANIERVDAVIACTESDETNAVVARMARAFFSVPKVIARLFDQQKVSIYNALGIQVIASTDWAIGRTREILTSTSLEAVLSIGNEGLKVVRIEVPELLVGKHVGDITRIGEIAVTAISRINDSIIPVSGTILEKGDVLYITVVPEATKLLKSILGM